MKIVIGRWEDNFISAAEVFISSVRRECNSVNICNTYSVARCRARLADSMLVYKGKISGADFAQNGQPFEAINKMARYVNNFVRSDNDENCASVGSRIYTWIMPSQISASCKLATFKNECALKAASCMSNIIPFRGKS